MRLMHCTIKEVAQKEEKKGHLTSEDNGQPNFKGEDDGRPSDHRTRCLPWVKGLSAGTSCQGWLGVVWDKVMNMVLITFQKVYYFQ